MRPRRKIATNSQRRRAVFALIAVFLLSAASCVPATDEATLGEIGALSFSFPLTGERSLGLEHPIAMNQLAEIRIRSRGGARLPSPLAVAVDDPSIASCQARYRLSDEIRIACRGVREGIAELRVVAADGAIVD